MIDVNFKRPNTSYLNSNLIGQKNKFLLDRSLNIYPLSSDTVSFRESDNSTVTEQKDKLTREYMRLATQPRLTPINIFGNDDGSLIASQLYSGKPLKTIFQEYKDELDVTRIKRLLQKKVENYADQFKKKGIKVPEDSLNKTFREIIDEYCLYTQQIQELLQKISILGESLEPKSTDQGEITSYNQHISKMTGVTGNPNTSSFFRYPDLHRVMSVLINNKVNQMNTTAPNENNKLDILLVGLGQQCEELFDYAMYMQDNLSNTPFCLEDIVKMQIVDFRPKKDFTLRYDNPPVINKEFIEDPELSAKIGDQFVKHPRFSDFSTYPTPVWDFAYNNINNPEVFHSSCAIEDFVKNNTGKNFDFISINNVLQYPGYGEYNSTKDIQSLPERFRFKNPLKFLASDDYQNFGDYQLLLQKIFEMVKPGGLISCYISNSGCNVRLERYIKLMPNAIDFEKISEGLYRRKSSKN